MKKPAEGESQDLQWLSRDEIAQIDQSKMLQNVRQIALYVFDELLNSDQFEPVQATEYRLDTPARPIVSSTD